MISSLLQWFCWGNILPTFQARLLAEHFKEKYFPGKNRRFQVKFCTCWTIFFQIDNYNIQEDFSELVIRVYLENVLGSFQAFIILQIWDKPLVIKRFQIQFWKKKLKIKETTQYGHFQCFWKINSIGTCKTILSRDMMICNYYGFG
jgi:hypothetical protein